MQTGKKCILTQAKTLQEYDTIFLCDLAVMQRKQISKPRVFFTCYCYRIHDDYRLQCSLRLFAKSCKSLRISNSDIRKNFTLKHNACLLESVHKTAIRKTIDACCRIDSLNPELSEFSLLVSTVTVSIVSRLHDLLVCHLEKLALMTEIALCSLQNLIMTRSCTRTLFYS